MSAQRDYSPRQREVMLRHGYDPDVPYRGLSGPGGTFPETVTLPAVRNRICYLEGMRIDPHEASDLDPGSTSCIHCGRDFTISDDFRQVDVGHLDENGGA